MLVLYCGNSVDKSPRFENIANPSVEQIIHYIKRLDGIEYLEVSIGRDDKDRLIIFSSPEERFHLIYMRNDHNVSRTQSKFLVDTRLSKETQAKFLLSNGQRDSFSLYGTVTRDAILTVAMHFLNTGMLLPDDKLPDGLAWGDDSFDIYA